MKALKEFFVGLAKAFRIWHLKRRLRSTYIAYANEFATRKGGHYMIQMTSASMHGLAVEFDKITAELEKYWADISAALRAIAEGERTMNLFDRFIWWLGFCPVCWVYERRALRAGFCCNECYWRADTHNQGPDFDEPLER